MGITYGSICSGIEAASVAWEPLGFIPTWFAEIEPFPSAVLAYRWPNVPNLGDMTKISRRVLSESIPAPDILVGGTHNLSPCLTSTDRHGVSSVSGVRRFTPKECERLMGFEDEYTLTLRNWR